MRLTKNFNIEEFFCNDGTPIPAAYLNNVQELAENLQVLRDKLDTPIYINSAYRHKVYNTNVGGSPKSQHLLAKAADIRTDKHTPNQIHQAIEELIKEGKMKNGGVGLYNTFVHYDVRDYVARWNYQK